MASTVWKGYVAFGLVSIPIRLFAAVRDERISFNQIHKVCNSRIQQQLFCPACDRVVERSELAKGYQISKDNYILVEDEEIKKIAPPSSETMEIQQFVKLDEIDPMYFDASYYTVPEEPGRRAYQLLLTTMKSLDYVALAQVTMHQREHTVALRPQGDGLMLHTMYYANEVRALPEYGNQTDVELKAPEVQMAEKLVAALASPFEPEKFHDQYQKKLLEMVEAKGEGRAVKGGAPKHMAPVIDLMQALQNSLAGVTKEAPPARKQPAKAEKAKTVSISPKGKKAG
jgi:DNA end-binding protein Ku